MADSRLTPGLIVLDKGLNLQAPKITAPEGSVLDSLNYEQVDFQGQKRIDGYVRYDGKLGSYIDDYYYTDTIEASGIGRAYIDDDGYVVGVWVDYNVLAIIDYNRLPAGAWGSTVDSPEDHYALLLGYNDTLRSTIGKLPGPVAGLHWFNDRLYAIAPLTKITVDLWSEQNPRVGDALLIGGLDNPVPVLWVLDYTTYIVGAPSLEESLGSSFYVDATGAEGEILTATTIDTASFFESRTEIQALNEDADEDAAGWRFVHQGWSVNFADGSSLYGSLPSLNQNLQGLGVQGPTSVAGSNGQALTLLQKVSIASRPTQVNGWKSSQTPTSFLLDSGNLGVEDSVYIYGDAFVSWNGTTGAVSAPGATSGNLVEYPATNTVEIIE